MLQVLSDDSEMSIIISYKDADIYPSDLALFQGLNWLNDSCINYCMKRIVDDYVSADVTAILLMEPAVISFMRIQCQTDEDFEELAVDLDFNSKTWLLAPLNDCDSFESRSSHWSLLLMHIPSSHSFHFDSSSNYNIQAARSTVSVLSKVLRS